MKQKISFPTDDFRIFTISPESGAPEMVYIYFPDDCPLAGQFFSVKKSAAKRDEENVEVTLDESAEIYLISDKTKKTRRISWFTLAMQIDTYFVEKKKRSIRR